jgi:uroporphyrinogen decarboxylase
MNEGYPTFDSGKPVNPVDHFDFDLAGCGGWFPWKAKLENQTVIEETDQWKVVRDGNGSALKWWKHKMGTPEHVDFHMTSRSIWEKDYKPHVVGSIRRRVTPERVDRARAELARRRNEERWTFYGHQFIWENMRGAFGDMALYENLLLDPDWIHDYCRTYTDLYTEGFRILLEEAGKPDGIWLYEDLGYKDSLFCSPDTFRELIFPYYAEMVELFHSYDLPVVLHSCGYTEPALPLIVEAGFDALNPMEVKAGNDPLAFAEKYGDKLAFVGGLDARILESGDRETIERGVTDLIEGMKSRGASFVYASDHSISPRVSYADFRYSLEVYRDHMWYNR